ncbi:MAG: DUF3575 domain-containing protein [Rikenellaceae bacterium]
MWASNFFSSKKIIVIAAALLLSGNLYGQNDSLSVKIYFNQGSDTLDDQRDIKELHSSIDSIEHDSLREITNINIEGFSSPEGSRERNDELAFQRAEALKNYLVTQFNLPDSLISTSAKGVAWQELKEVLERVRPEEADQIERAIRNNPEFSSATENQYLFDNLYPRLRYAEVSIFSHRLEAILSQPSPAVQQPQEVTYNNIEESSAVVTTATPLLAIKSNLLFDLATLVNLEVEVPIQKRWSLCAELIFPWWVMDNGRADSRRNRIQILSGTLEAKYWLRQDENRPILTGWFCGLYTGVGSYDLEHRAKGYQGDFFIGAGVSGGYAHTINRAENLRLEYSLGVGYLETNYTYYHAEFCNNSCWHAIEQRSGKYLWVGPTRAKVSLSWLINRRR